MWEIGVENLTIATRTLASVRSYSLYEQNRTTGRARTRHLVDSHRIAIKTSLSQHTRAPLCIITRPRANATRKETEYSGYCCPLPVPVPVPVPGMPKRLHQSAIADQRRRPQALGSRK